MIHGAGGGGWEYDRWKPIFQKANWRVIAPDLLPTKAGLAATTFEDYVAQVKQWVPKEHGQLVLVGASLGGILALKAAESVRPDAIVLVNSVTPLDVGAARPFRTYPPVILWANGPVKDTRDALPDGDEATIQWAAPKWRDESGAVLNTVSQGVKAQKPSVPTLVILGAQDADIPTESGLALAHWAGADTQIYAKTSHIGPLYGLRAEEIANAALRWLDSRLLRKGPGTRSNH